MIAQVNLIINTITLGLIGWLFWLEYETKHPRYKNQAVLDTSSLIDGRIEQVAESGFLTGVNLLVPQFVLAELQLLADNKDELKRARGRLGLEMVQKLQAIRTVKVEVIKDDTKSTNAVDDKLLYVAKKRVCPIVTTDFNLNKVATIQDIRILNVNELAQSLRPSVLPGEQVKIKIVQRGSESHQGVGYLTDGTMVVVDQASRFMGKEVTVQVQRIIQTAAGRMLFAQVPKAGGYTNSIKDSAKKL
jgi:uncharacterized protein YacL